MPTPATPPTKAETAVPTPPDTTATEASEKPFEVGQKTKDRLVSLFLNGRGDDAPAEPEAKPEKPKKDDAAAKPPEGEPADKAPEKPVGEAAPTEPAKTTKVKRRRDVDPIDVAAIASRAAAEATQEVLSKQAKPPPKTDAAPPLATTSDEVPAKYARKLTILEQMAADNPSRYGSIVSDFKRSIKRVDEYQAQWERQNPGKKFDPDDDEHNAFFDVNDIDYADDDYNAALVAVHTKPLAESAKKAEKLEVELEAMRKKEKAREQEPALRQVMEAAAAETLKGIDEKILEQAKTPETLKAYVESNPDEAEIVISHAKLAGELSAEATRIMDGGEVDDKSEVTREFLTVKNHLEDAIKKQPLDDQYDERNRRFVTWAEFVELAKKDADAANKYWYLGKAELAKLIPHEVARIAKEKVKDLNLRLERFAKARGYAKVESAPESAKPAKEEKAKPATAAPPPTAPAGQARTQIDPVPGTSENQGGEGWKNNLFSIFSGNRV